MQGDNIDGDNVIILVIMMIFMMVVMFLVVRMVVVLGHNCSGSDTNTSLIICDDDHNHRLQLISPLLLRLLANFVHETGDKSIHLKTWLDSFSILTVCSK